MIKMSCNCNGICTQACAKGAVEPEDMVIEFENKIGETFVIYRHCSDNWCIERTSWGLDHPILYFDSLIKTKECAEILKESV